MHLQEPIHESALEGQRVHAAVEALLRGRTPEDVTPGELQAARELVALTLEVGQPTHLEHSFTWPLPGTHTLVRGTIDALYADRGLLVDHKTKRRAKQAKHLPRGKKFRTDPQAVLYAAWYFDAYPNRQHVDLRWQYVWVPGDDGPEHPPVVVLDRLSREAVQSEVAKIVRQVQRMEAEEAGTVDPKRNFWACFRFGPGHECPFTARCGVINKDVVMKLSEIKKKPKSTPALAVVPDPPAGTVVGVQTLYVNCLPETRDQDVPVIHVDTILADAELSVAHWRLLSYSQGEAELEDSVRKWVAKLQGPVDVVLETGSGSNRAVVPYLRSIARRVVRGIL